MNQHFGTGLRGNRGGRGHYHPGRFQPRYPQQNFKNHNYNQNNNNNSQKCFNQNLEQCSNPNMDQGEFHPSMDRSFANASGNPPYLVNDSTGYPMEPAIYHASHQPHMVYDVPSFAQPQFSDMSMGPQMLPQMQLLNYPQTPYLPPSVVYGVFPPAGMTQSQAESYNLVKDGSTRSHSRESFHEADLGESRPMATIEYGVPRVQSCVECAGKESQFAAKIRELETEKEAILAKNRTLEEEVATLGDQLRVALAVKDVPLESTDVKAGLSATAEPFVAKLTTGGENCSGGGGPMWPPDAVEQGFEQTCTDLIAIIKDKPEDAWPSPVNPVVPIPTIPVVSANVPWSEMLDNETEANAEGAGGGFDTRGRVLPGDHARQSGQDARGSGHQSRAGRHSNYQANQSGYQSNQSGYQGGQSGYSGPHEQGVGRGAQRQGIRRNQDQRGYHSHGLNSNLPPDPTGSFGPYRNQQNRGGYQHRPRQYTAPQCPPTNWRGDRSSESTEQKDATRKEREPTDPPAVIRDRQASSDRKVTHEDDDGDVVTDACVKVAAKVEEPKVDEKAVDELKVDELKVEKRAESRDRPGRGRSDSYQKGGSGDRRSQGGVAESEPRQTPKVDFITEVDGDLFKADASFSLAHCVAADLQMGSGIAVTFRDQFKRVDELMDQHKEVGQVAILPDKGRFIYYLITKQRSQWKPTMDSLERSLWDMAEHCHANGVKKLAMPRIGCGLDKLNWTQVKLLIGRVFDKSGVKITIYNYPQGEESLLTTQNKKKSSLYVVQRPLRLVDIATSTGLLYICGEDDTISPAMESLNVKHNFLPSFRAAKRVCGDIVATVKSQDVVLYGLVVRKTAKDRLSYGHLMSCLKKIRTRNNVDYFTYFGLEAFRDGGDELTMHKIITIFRNVFGGCKYNLEFWVCFPEQFANDMDVQLPSTT